MTFYHALDKLSKIDSTIVWKLDGHLKQYMFLKLIDDFITTVIFSQIGKLGSAVVQISICHSI